jgi:DNA-directed RNA polymerase-4 subunit 1
VSIAVTAYVLLFLTYFILFQLHSKKTYKESSTGMYRMKRIKDANMVGDPKIRLHEIGISMDLASNLVVSKHVNSYNIENINLKCNLHLRAKEILFTQRKEELIHVKKAN